MRSPVRFGRLVVAGLVTASIVGRTTDAGLSPGPTGGHSPTAPPPPSQAPTATAPVVSPAPAGWPYVTPWAVHQVLFADDGRVVFIEGDWGTNRARAVTLDANGRTATGWPWAPASTGDPIARAAFGPDGSLYVILRGAAGSPIGWSWALHRLDAAASEMPGFPVALPAVPACDLLASDAGVVFVTCEVEADAGAVSTIVTAVQPDGSAAAGWPVRMAGSPGGTSLLSDGTVLVGVGTEQGSTLTALRPDGAVVPGWPRDVPAGSTVLERDGRLYLTHREWAEGQCAPAIRTTYVALEPDGRTADGWPVSLDGWASEPEITDDGTVYVVTEAGRAIAYAAGGQEVEGWPGHEVGVTVACGSGSGIWSAGSDGLVTVGGGSATMLAPVGQPRADWQLALPYTAADACLWCTPGPAGPLAPVVGAKGIYVAAYDGNPRGDALPGAQPRIVVLDPSGVLADDRQQAVGDPGDEIVWLRMDPTGRVWVLLDDQQGHTSLHLVATDSPPRD